MPPAPLPTMPHLQVDVLGERHLARQRAQQRRLALHKTTGWRCARHTCTWAAAAQPQTLHTSLKLAALAAAQQHNAGHP